MIAIGQHCIATIHMPAYSMCLWSGMECGMERNGTEWKKLIKHGTELLSRHKARLCTHGPQSYTHANCSCTLVRRERLADRFAHSFSCKRIESRLHAPYQLVHSKTKRDATAQYDDDDVN